MRKVLSFALAGVVLASATPAFGKTAQEIADAFAHRESILDIRLSPDGTRAVVVMPDPNSDGTIAVVSSLTGTVTYKGILSTAADSGSDHPDVIDWCGWASSTRIICELKVTQISAAIAKPTVQTRLVIMNDDGSNLSLLSPTSNIRTLQTSQFGGGIVYWGSKKHPDLLVTREFHREETTGTRLASDLHGIGLQKVNPQTLSRSLVERPTNTSFDYIADRDGKVRIRGTGSYNSIGYVQDNISYQYRTPGSDNWKHLSDYNLTTEEGFEPVAVDSEKNIAYGYGKQNGRLAVFTMALDGSDRKQLLFARPDVDVGGLWRIGRTRRVVGVDYTTDKTYVKVFDPDLAHLIDLLHGAVPSLPLLDIVDANEDESVLLVYAGSDTDPGHYYLYDKATHHFDEIFQVRPELRGIPMGTVKPISYPASDGTMIPGYLTLPPGSDGKNLPTIVMPHGGPSARDTWGFDWLSQYFVARGFAVLQPNFRGSSGYGDAWFRDQGFKSWRTAIGDVDDAGRWLIKQGIADPSKLAIVGWSYGGYAALQSQVLDPDLFKAVVAIAPVTDLQQLKDESLNFTDRKLTADFIGSGPQIEAGSPARHADRFKAPVLMFHGTLDGNVNIAESRLMLDRLHEAGTQAKLVTFDNLDHQLADHDAREKMLMMSDAFLRKNLGMK